MSRHDEAAALARSIFQLRQERSRHLPASVLSDAAWNILLALFIADADGRRVSGAEVLRTAELSIQVGERWTTVLRQEGLLVGDGTGDLDAVIALTPAGVSAVEACMLDAQAHFRAVAVRQ